MKTTGNSALAKIVALAFLAAYASPARPQAAVSGFVYNPGARILADMARKGYTETVEDMHVKVLGGYVRINRTLVDANWEFNQHWAPAIATSGCGGKKIKRGQYEYFYTGTETVTYQGEEREADIFAFFTDRRIIAIQDPNNPPPTAIAPASGSGGGGGPAIGCVDIPVEYVSIRWEDSFGNWIDYDGQNGRIERYGDRNDVEVTFDYDGQGQLDGVNDHFGNRIVTFSYQTYSGRTRISKISDYTNREVSYIWSPNGGTLDQVVDIRKSIWTYTYNNDGRLTKVVDPENRQKIISLGPTGGVESVVKAEEGETKEDGVGTSYSYAYDQTSVEFTAIRRKTGGREESVTYDQNGFVVRHDLNGDTLYTVDILNGTRKRVRTDHNGNIVTSEYDERSNLTRRVHEDGSVITVSYNKYSQPLRVVDEVGTVTRYEYDTNGNLERLTEAAGTTSERITEYVYDVYGQVIEVKSVGDLETAEAITTFTYDNYGNLRTVTDPLNRESSWNYDVMGNVTEHVDRRNKLWRVANDEAGNIVSMIDPLNQEMRFQYDAVGNLVVYKDAELTNINFSYDARDNLVGIENVLGGIKSFAYDGNDEPISVTDESGISRSEDRLVDSRLWVQRDGVGNEIALDYGDKAAAIDGPYGRPKSITYPTFSRTLQYDRRGRIERAFDTVNGEELETLYEYDRASRLIGHIDPRGYRQGFSRDPLGRVTRMVDALLDETRIQINDRDRTTRVTDPRGKTTTFEYDLLDRLVAEEKPLGQRTTYQYDEEGNRTQVNDANGQKMTFSYDDGGRLQTIAHFRDADNATPDRIHTLAYTALNLIGTWADGETSGLRRYDELGRLIEETVDYGAFSLTYRLTYNANGTVETFTDADDVEYRYIYDSDSKPQGLIIPGIGTVAINEFDWLERKQISLPGGITEVYERTSYLEASEITVRDSASNTIARRIMDYDAARNLSAKDTEEGANSYTYDEASRLTSAIRSAASDTSYTYDGMGNRLTLNGAPEVWQYDDNNRLITTGRTNYNYDDNGNITSKTENGITTYYFYDVMNRLERVENDSGSVIAEYGYDVFSRRIWKEIAGVRTYYFYSASGLIGEYDAVGNQITAYGYLPGEMWGMKPVFLKSENGYNFYHNDHLGTPYMLTDRDGSITWKAISDPFGATTISNSTITNNLRLPGQYYDGETGLHYNYYRTLDPSTGRYLQSDPIGFLGGINTYTYALANPMVLYDPYGLWTPPSLPQGLVDGVTGFGDTMSFGITSWVRDTAGIDGGVDKCSGAYRAGEIGGVAVGLGFGAASLGRHALANGAKSLATESRTFGTVSRRWHRRHPNGDIDLFTGRRVPVDLDHMFFPKPTGVNSGWNLVPLSRRVNRMWLNPKNTFWTKKHPFLGQFVPQTLRSLTQLGVVGLHGAAPTAAARNLTRDCECQ